MTNQFTPKFQIVAVIHATIYTSWADDDTLDQRIKNMKAVAFDRGDCGAAINILEEDEWIDDNDD